MSTQPTRTDSAHGHERSERAEPSDPCRDALRDAEAALDRIQYTATYFPTRGETTASVAREARKAAQAALATENPLPALVEALAQCEKTLRAPHALRCKPRGNSEGMALRAIEAARQALAKLREGGRS